MIVRKACCFTFYGFVKAWTYEVVIMGWVVSYPQTSRLCECVTLYGKRGFVEAFTIGI